jgi:NADPH:quinone reductase-like Zn-dependent oxidoreductase
MTFEEAAAVMFGGFSALNFLRKANIQAGQNVLIHGASGSVGIFAVQLAKYFGARVTAVCSSRNLELVSKLGAHEIVDYAREDFSHVGRVYDIVFDAVGKSGLSRSLKSLKRGGRYVMVAGPAHLSLVLGAIWVSAASAAKVVIGAAGGDLKDLAFLKGLIEEGKLRTVIDRRYSLDEIVEAHRYAEAGHKKGHVVVILPATP